MKRFKLLASTVIAALMVVPNVVMAQNEVTELSEETTITFEEFSNGTTIADELVNYKGLYLRYAEANHHLLSKTSNRSGTFSDGTTWSVPVAAYSQSTNVFNYLSEKPDWAPNSTIQNNNRDCIAFTTSCAGKVYVVMAPSSVTAERYMKIWFKGNSDANYTEKVSQEATAKTPFVLETETTEGGHFFVGATISCYIYAIRFVPSTTPLTIGSTGYATFCSKADLDISGFADKFKAYYVSDVNGSNVVMTEIKDVIPAGTGVIVNGDAGTYNLQRASTGATEITGNMLQAVTEETLVSSTAEGYQNYVLIEKNGNAVFYKVEETGRTFSAGKAYLKVPVESASKQMLGIAFDNEATGISSVEKNVMHNDVYYNLNGQRVEKPTKGMYIINNKKVVVK